MNKFRRIEKSQRGSNSARTDYKTKPCKNGNKIAALGAASKELIACMYVNFVFALLSTGSKEELLMIRRADDFRQVRGFQHRVCPLFQLSGFRFIYAGLRPLRQWPKPAGQ